MQHVCKKTIMKNVTKHDIYLKCLKYFVGVLSGNLIFRIKCHEKNVTWETNVQTKYHKKRYNWKT